MKNYRVFYLVLLMGIVIPCTLRAQNTDTLSGKKKEMKNIIRYNLSGPLIFGHSYVVFGYERTVGTHQSFSVNIGAFGLPAFTGSDSLAVGANRKNEGFHVSGDYRFYLSGENRYPAPHGVYIGPYYSYNHLSRENTWMFNSPTFTGNVDVAFDVNIHTAGLELGYQFVLFKRMTLDFVAVGPGVAYYSFKNNLTSNLSPEKHDELLAAIADKLKEKLPMLSSYFNNEEYKKNAGIKAWSIGYRYIVQIGFRF
ncbi:DUF3575 domain-containing protein [Mucilaginibacter sp. AW1-3]